MLNSITASAGRLLVSEPFMMDPNFKRSVIILTEFGEAGAMGFVLNNQSETLLGDLLPDLSYSDMPVYIGGPVGADTLHFIHRCPDKISGGIELGDGIFWSGEFEQVKELLISYQLKPDEIKFFAGYSGWTAGQLDNELTEDTWIVANNGTQEIVFTHNEHDLWRHVVIGLGKRYAHIVNFPENPALN